MSLYALIQTGRSLAVFTLLAAFTVHAPAAAQTGAREVYGRLPLHFEANLGQTHPNARFLARGPGYNLHLTADEAVMTLTGPKPVVLRMAIVDAQPKVRTDGVDELPGKVNYFLGRNASKWRTNIPTYARVHYSSIYPGIDLVYYGNQQQLEYDFIVAPAANPEKIALSFEGADKLEIDAQGDLVLHVADGLVRQRKPVIYQEIDGTRHIVDGGYILKAPNRVGFKVAAYDRSRPLVIDPVLFYSTYLGGSSDDLGQGIAVDAAGNAYVTGATHSADFPTTAGAFQMTSSGGSDVFVTKLNPTGSGLVYSTYLGGNRDEVGLSIALDAAFNAYVTGQTSSADFPTTPGSFDTTFNGVADGFVTKLNATGSALVYSTYLGGSGNDFGIEIAVDSAFNAYVTGNTDSSDFPVTPGAFQTTYGGGTADAFVTKLNSTGSAPLYSTYLGGSNADEGRGIAVDNGFGAYVAGWTQSGDFPTSPGAFQPALAGGKDVFITKMNPAGTAPLVYSTYLGGSSDDVGTGIALDSALNAYVVGETSSGDFPTTAAAFQTTFGGGMRDAFVTKLNPVGTAPLVYSTYLGGSGDDFGTGIGVDGTLNAHVTGGTGSSDFPTSNAIQGTLAGGLDAFVTKLNPTGGAPLLYSTYLGGSSTDIGVQIALDSLPSPNAYVTGLTDSANFPTTPGAFQTQLAGGFDAFVVKISDVVLPPPPTVGKVTGGGTVFVAGGIANFGFIVQAKSTTGPVDGHLQYHNHASRANVQSVTFTSLVIAGNTATFSGTCTNNGVPCTFVVGVMDDGEPGNNDSFTISINAGPPEGGTLRSGNIQIHD